jgi:hypothetical protein
VKQPGVDYVVEPFRPFSESERCYNNLLVDQQRQTIEKAQLPRSFSFSSKYR